MRLVLLVMLLHASLARADAEAAISLDVDFSGEVSPLTDGLLIIRHLFGFEGESLTTGAIAPDAFRKEPEQISEYISSLENLDVDDDGSSQALTDGLLIIRSLFGFSGESLISGALPSSSTGVTAEELKSRIEELTFGNANPRDFVGSAYNGSSLSGPFSSEPVNLDVEVTNNSITIEAGLFFSDDLLLEGSIALLPTSLDIQGTYRNASFQEGNWSANYIEKFSEDTLVLNLSLNQREVSWIAFIPESDLDLQPYSRTASVPSPSTSSLNAATGTYSGLVKTYDSCSERVFEISDTDFSIDWGDDSLVLRQDSFHEGTCVLEGGLSFSGYSGTFQCSNFKDGNWEANEIMYLEDKYFYASLTFAVDNDDCTFRRAYLLQR